MVVKPSQLILMKVFQTTGKHYQVFSKKSGTLMRYTTGNFVESRLFLMRHWKNWELKKDSRESSLSKTLAIIRSSLIYPISRGSSTSPSMNEMRRRIINNLTSSLGCFTWTSSWIDHRKKSMSLQNWKASDVSQIMLKLSSLTGRELPWLRIMRVSWIVHSC